MPWLIVQRVNCRENLCARRLDIFDVPLLRDCPVWSNQKGHMLRVVHRAEGMQRDSVSIDRLVIRIGATPSSRPAPEQRQGPHPQTAATPQTRTGPPPRRGRTG